MFHVDLLLRSEMRLYNSHTGTCDREEIVVDFNSLDISTSSEGSLGVARRSRSLEVVLAAHVHLVCWSTQDLTCQ